MSKRSKLEAVPVETKAEIDRAIRERGYGGYEELRTLFSEKHGIELSYGAIAAYGLRLRAKDESAENVANFDIGACVERMVEFTNNYGAISIAVEAAAHEMFLREFAKGDDANFAKVRDAVSAVKGLRSLRNEENALKLRKDLANAGKAEVVKTDDKETAKQIIESFSGKLKEGGEVAATGN